MWPTSMVMAPIVRTTKLVAVCQRSSSLATSRPWKRVLCTMNHSWIPVRRTSGCNRVSHDETRTSLLSYTASMILLFATALLLTNRPCELKMTPYLRCFGGGIIMFSLRLIDEKLFYRSTNRKEKKQYFFHEQTYE